MKLHGFVEELKVTQSSNVAHELNKAQFKGFVAFPKIQNPAAI